MNIIQNQDIRRIQILIIIAKYLTANTNMDTICEEYSQIYFNIQIFAALWSVGTQIGHFGWANN